jgi:hypothetical protein
VLHVLLQRCTGCCGVAVLHRLLRRCSSSRCYKLWRCSSHCCDAAAWQQVAVL